MCELAQAISLKKYPKSIFYYFLVQAALRGAECWLDWWFEMSAKAPLNQSWRLAHSKIMLLVSAVICAIGSG